MRLVPLRTEYLTRRIIWTCVRKYFCRKQSDDDTTFCQPHDQRPLRLSIALGTKFCHGRAGVPRLHTVGTNHGNSSEMRYDSLNATVLRRLIPLGSITCLGLVNSEAESEKANFKLSAMRLGPLKHLSSTFCRLSNGDFWEYGLTFHDGLSVRIGLQKTSDICSKFLLKWTFHVSTWTPCLATSKRAKIGLAWHWNSKTSSLYYFLLVSPNHPGLKSPKSIGMKLFNVNRERSRRPCASNCFSFSSTVLSLSPVSARSTLLSAVPCCCPDPFSSLGGTCGFFLSRNSLHSIDPKMAIEAAPRPNPNDSRISANAAPPIFPAAPERSGVEMSLTSMFPERRS